MWTSKGALFNIYKWVKIWIFIVLRFPCLPQDYIESNLRRAKKFIGPKDIKIIMASACSCPKWPTILIMLIYFVYAMRNVFFIVIAFSMYNYNDLESNLIEIKDQADDKVTQLGRVFKFTCLETNCTRLSYKVAGEQKEERDSANLASDFSRLPLFTICNPSIDSLMNPFVRLESFGLLIFTCGAFYVFLLGVSIPLQQLVAPASAEAAMFMSTPEACVQMMRSKCKRLMFDVNVSYLNFCSQILAGDEQQKWTRRRRGGADQEIKSTATSKDNHSSVNYYGCNTYVICNVDNEGHHQSPRHQQDDGDFKLSIIMEPGDEQSMADCMPIIRSQWWHPKLIKLFCFQYLSTSVSLIWFVLAIFAHINGRLASKSLEWKQFQQQAEAANCRLWKSIGLGGGHTERQYVDLSQLSTGWTLGQAIESGYSNFFPAFNAITLPIFLWLVLSELSCWLAELQTYLLACLACCSFKRSSAGAGRSGSSGSSGGSSGRQPKDLSVDGKLMSSMRSAEFSVGRLRGELMHQFELRGIILARRIEGQLFMANSKSVDVILAQRMRNRLVHLDAYTKSFPLYKGASHAGHLLDNGSHADHKATGVGQFYCLHDEEDDLNVETLERVYVQFRLFLDYVEGSSACITLLSSLAYTLTYGLVLIGVFFSSQVRNLGAEPAVLIVVGWMSSNLFIILTANFHANTKRLQALIWSIIAQLSNSNNLRARHMRLLWTKQMRTLDMEGQGIAIKAFKIRVTYVNLIQVLIWTGTILVIALKPHQ